VIICNQLIFILFQDSPEKGVLYLLQLLIEKLKEIEFDVSAQSTQSIIYMNIIDVLSHYAQESYPCHFQNVISNDELYGSDIKFINEINEISTRILNELLKMLQIMSENPKLQCLAALELFERVATKADVTDEKLYSLAVNLWNLSIKNRQHVDSKIHIKMYAHVKSVRAVTRNQKHGQRLDELLNRIKNKL
jgi:hypothetical protein